MRTQTDWALLIWSLIPTYCMYMIQALMLDNFLYKNKTPSHLSSSVSTAAAESCSQDVVFGRSCLQWAQSSWSYLFFFVRIFPNWESGSTHIFFFSILILGEKKKSLVTEILNNAAKNNNNNKVVLLIYSHNLCMWTEDTWLMHDWPLPDVTAGDPVIAHETI